MTERRDSEPNLDPHSTTPPVDPSTIPPSQPTHPNPCASQGPEDFHDLPTAVPTDSPQGQPANLSGPVPQGGRYHFLHLHARGGLGEVHLGEDTELNRQVALKRIRPHLTQDPESRRRFLVEAEITARLEHPGVVPIHGLIQDERGELCYAMRFIEGQSLKEAIEDYRTQTGSRNARANRLAFRLLIQRLTDVCNTIAYAHSRGVLHRDLKPANVMLGKFGETLVVDWGLARQIDSPDEDTETCNDSALDQLKSMDSSLATRTGAIIGTPSYMSPEQASGESGIDHRSDVHALGSILYVILTGKVSIAEGNAFKTIERVRQGDFPRPRERNPNVENSLEAICLKAMELRPEDRYESALIMAQDLERWLAGEPVIAFREPWTERCGRWMRRNRSLVTGMLVLLFTALIGLGLGLVLVGRERNEAQRQRDYAENQKELAIQASEKAQAKEVEAREQNLLAVRTLTKVVQSIQTRLKYLPGAGPVRRRLLHESLEDLTKVTRRIETESQTDHLILLAHQDLGELYLHAGGGVEDEPDRWAKSAALAGWTQRAQSHFEQVFAIAQRRAKQYPNDSQTQREWAGAHFRLGQLQWKQGNLEATRQLYDKMLAILKQAPVHSETAEGIRSDIAIGLQGVGDVLYRLGKPKEALTRYRESLSIRQKIAHADPKDFEKQRTVANSWQRLGFVEMDLGHPKTALEHFQKMNQIYADLVKREGIYLQGLIGLSFSHRSLGDTFLELKDPKAALKHFEKMHEIQLKLYETDPTSAMNHLHLSYSHESLARALSRSGSIDNAMEHYDAALKLREEASRLDPEDRQLLRQLARLRENVGALCLEQKQFQSAREHLRVAVDLAKQLTKSSRDARQNQTLLSRTTGLLGFVCLKMEDYAPAREYLETAYEMDRKSERDHPQSAKARLNLCISADRLGDLLAKTGSPEQARKHFTESLQVRQKELISDPKSVELRLALALSHFKLTFVAKQIYDYADVLKQSRSGLQLIQGLERAGKLPGDPMAQTLKKSLVSDYAVASQVMGVMNDLQSALRMRPGDAGYYLEIRQKVLAREGKHAEIIKTAEMLLMLKGNVGVNTYDAACGYVLAGEALSKSKASRKLSDDEKALKQNWTARAVELLKLSLKLGFQNYQYASQDPTLDPLRERSDFQEWLAELKTASKK